MKWFFEYPDWQKWLPKSPHRIEVENCANCEYSEGGCKYIPQNLCQKHYNLWRCASWTRQLTPEEKAKRAEQERKEQERRQRNKEIANKYSKEQLEEMMQVQCREYFITKLLGEVATDITVCRLRGTDWQEYPKRIIKEMQRLLKPKEMAKVVELDLFDGGAV